MTHGEYIVHHKDALEYHTQMSLQHLLVNIQGFKCDSNCDCKCTEVSV